MLIRTTDSSYVANTGKFLVTPLLAVDGLVTLSSKPGLGRELNMDRVREWTFQ
jgi:hypothetical protein